MGAVLSSSLLVSNVYSLSLKRSACETYPVRAYICITGCVIPGIKRGADDLNSD